MSFTQGVARARLDPEQQLDTEEGPRPLDCFEATVAAVTIAVVGKQAVIDVSLREGLCRCKRLKTVICKIFYQLFFDDSRSKTGKMRGLIQ